MTIEANKQIIIKWIETFNTRDLAAIEKLADEIFSPEWISYTPFFPDNPHDREGWKQMIRQILTDFPDYQILSEDVIAEDDKVVMRGRYTGTTAATKEPFAMDFIGIARISGGKIVELIEMNVPVPTPVGSTP